MNSKALRARNRLKQLDNPSPNQAKMSSPKFADIWTNTVTSPASTGILVATEFTHYYAGWGEIAIA
jgi:hypothetical protein